jgi:hypothetical protein
LITGQSPVSSFFHEIALALGCHKGSTLLMGDIWIGGIDIRDVLGPIGVFSYIGAYLALQLGLIRGNGYLFPTLNLFASVSILISLTRDFNPYSTLIEIAWSTISIIGIARLFYFQRVIKFSNDQAEAVRLIAPTLKKDMALRTSSRPAVTYTAQKGRTNDRNLRRSTSAQINPCKTGAVHK